MADACLLQSMQRLTFQAFQANSGNLPGKAVNNDPLFKYHSNVFMARRWALRHGLAETEPAQWP